jgi:hypothetical protein
MTYVVDIKEILHILAKLRAPIHLVKQIIEAFVKEETSLQWYRQRTQYETKTKGVKQGCPLSPTLFVYALYDVLRRMAKIMSTITLNDVEDDIKLPLIFAYEDDLILLCDKREVSTGSTEATPPDGGLTTKHGKIKCPDQEPIEGGGQGHGSS